MQVTTAGLVIIPVLLAIVALRRSWLVPALILLGPLASVSVLNVSVISFGLQPSAAAGMLLIATLAPDLLRRRSWLLIVSGVGQLTPLFVLAIWAFVSGQLLSRLFAGTSVRTADGDTEPLQVGLLHFTQFGYLLFGILVAAGVLMWLRTPAARQRALRALVWSGWLAALLGVVQIREATSPTWLSDVLFNNPGFALLVDQRISGSVRLASTLIEPSVAAVFFGGYTAAIVALLVNGGHSRRRWWWLIASMVVGLTCLIATRSTTGFLALGIIGVVLVWRLATARRRTEWLAVGLLGAVGVVVAVTFALRAGYLNDDNAVVSLISGMTTEKSGSDSAAVRLAGEELAWEGFRSSKGFGLGWGSSRAFSLASTIMTNLGVLGAALIVWFAVRMQRLRTSAAGRPSPSPLFEPARSFAIVSFGAAAFSAPDVTFTFFWVPLGMWAASLLPDVVVMRRVTPATLAAARIDTSRHPAARRPQPSGAPVSVRLTQSAIDAPNAP